MKLIIKTEKFNVIANSNRDLIIEIDDVSTKEVLDSVEFSDVLEYFGEDWILDSFGSNRLRQHLGLPEQV